jgi:pyruvate/2-oxoglutarate dehydrogenase complex dihydrolipoamide dehydrogenase (E3) component
MTISLLSDDPHDRQLVANVHPLDWVNPPAAPRYNLVVVGAGTAGLVCAAGAAQLGARVALVERELLGGDCLNVGCVPSKALLAAARTAAAVRDAATFGIRVPAGAEADFAAVMERLRRLRAEISPHDSAARLTSLGVDVFLGQGAFTGPDTLAVAGQQLRFSCAVIATGARAKRPDIPGLAEAGFLTNENVFAMTALPPRLAVIGAGPIGCELAQAFARLGARVLLLDHNPRILSREDADAAGVVRAALERDGVEFILSAAVEQVQRHGGAKVLHIRGSRDAAFVLQREVDEILVGAGRQPNVEGMGLEAAGVRFDPRKGVVVDDRLRTSNARIYAAGDVCSRFQFTHAADAMARIVLQNALFLGRARVSALTIPWCTYTAPELARVGLSPAEAKEKGVAIDVFTQPLAAVDRAVLDGETEGFVRVLVKRGTDRIVGCTIVAAHAGEMMGEVSLAMTHGLGLRKLASTIHPYPTQTEALKKIGDAYNRTRLTPWVKWLLGKWLAWRR